jgi:hypothetical protein
VDYQVPEPEDCSQKEAYPFFGLAAYYAQVLEKGLVNMVVAFKTVGMSITQDQFDAVYETHDSKTFGQLVSAARAHQIPIPDKTRRLLEEALRSRNQLNHHFFADHAGHMATEAGRRTAIRRLSDLIRLFRAADRAIEPIYQPLLQKAGVTNEVMKQHIQRIVADGARDHA